MGMSASQAKLLMITARMHDVEYKSQSIQNAKITLATESDEVYEDYLHALDETTLTIKDYDGNIITASFNNIVGFNAIQNGNKYAFKTNGDRLVVPDEIKRLYDEFVEEGTYELNAFNFAFYATNGNYCTNQDIKDAEKEIGDGHSENETLVALRARMNDILEENGVQTYQELINPTIAGKVNENAIKEYKELEQAYNVKLYRCYQEEIFEKVYNEDNKNRVNYDESLFNYYMNMFAQIEASDGRMVAIGEYNGLDGDANMDSDWLQNMIKTGQFSMLTVDQDTTTGKVSFNGTTPETDTYVDYTTTATIDQVALAKAQAKYEHDTKEIDKKDKNFDLDLSKLDTQRSALDKEREDLDKVLSDNIERTYSIFNA